MLPQFIPTFIITSYYIIHID